MRGGGIYDFGNGLEIERIDDAELFDSDAAALAHVEAKAAGGSELHQRALAIHRRYESVPRI
jgi:hypothetical protein